VLGAPSESLTDLVDVDSRLDETQHSTLDGAQTMGFPAFSDNCHARGADYPSARAVACGAGME
jgi:hypothetical protein